jgi:hypothetical protein
MVDSRRARQALLGASLLFATLAPCRIASARTLQVRDAAHVLTADDIARLRADVASAPFDARLVVTTDHPDAQDLARYLEPLVSEPNMVIVGLDPEHHHVQVRFGTGSHVPEGSWSAIEKSGNDAFRRGAWEDGAAAIFRAASAVVSTGTHGIFAPNPAVQPASAGPGMAFIVIGGFVGIALLAAFLLRRRGVGPGGYGPSGYGPPPYGGGGYGYGPPGGGMGPVGGGLIGAGLGGLAGYELGKMEGQREGRDRDGGSGAANEGSDAGGGNYDGGGGGSDWDAGGGGGGFDGGDGGGGGGSDF